MCASRDGRQEFAVAVEAFGGLAATIRIGALN